MNQIERDRAERVISAAQRQIWVTWQREGIHKYPAALTDPNLADVEFLGYPHRHIFHFRVWIDVFHNDRDLEFIQFKRWCELLYNSDNSVLSLDHKSCEMMADDLYIQIAQRYPGRVVHIEVSEDGENGALIRYELTKPNLNIVI
jgi:transglutaminase-like putative cysteine protease